MLEEKLTRLVSEWGVVSGSDPVESYLIYLMDWFTGLEALIALLVTVVVVAFTMKFGGENSLLLMISLCIFIILSANAMVHSKLMEGKYSLIYDTYSDYIGELDVQREKVKEIQLTVVEEDYYEVSYSEEINGDQHATSLVVEKDKVKKGNKEYAEIGFKKADEDLVRDWNKKAGDEFFEVGKKYDQEFYLPKDVEPFDVTERS